MAKPTALVVGGGGYFGARLSEDLGTTHDVTITYRSTSPVREAWMAASGVRALPYDSSRDKGFATTDSFDVVVNLAMPGANEAKANPEQAVERGLATAGACAGLLDEGRAGRLVHFSTFHVYGGEGAPGYAETTPAAPKHPYGEAHLAVERFFEDREDVAILRPSNLVGAPAHGELGDQAGLIFLDLCRQAAQDGAMSLRNDGLSYRDILSFPDAITAVRAVAGAPDLGHRIFNLAAGEAVTLKEIAEGIAAQAPGSVPVTFGDGVDSFRAPFNIETARLRALCWAPRQSFTQEVPRTLSVFR